MSNSYKVSSNLISIIIPLFNRAALILETLESIQNQVFTNWECIVVDDGSNDDSIAVVSKFIDLDTRFKLLKRPQNRIKGANACRNIGFENSVGDYIIWFDSDDLMTGDHLAVKIQEIQHSKTEFVIAQTQNFSEKGLQEPYKYQKKKYGITVEDFILRKINWYTYDIMLTRELASQVFWHEHLSSWQDYNYFCKMLLVSTNGKYINQVLTKRRLHASSIQATMTKSYVAFSRDLLIVYRLTFIEIENFISIGTRKELVRNMMNLSYRLIKLKIRPVYFYETLGLVHTTFGKVASFYYLMALSSTFLVSKGEFLLEKAKCK
ncbi:glycosyltransferase family 2 protein [Leeuwenhoekiella sp. W20_SRS_FM14]|uniref:glycosyltransferase family 2 protein n=1 Tax=Leeuwenhoekiella sp. W20_SRS_FM14 TaxID=3240270 RepID=UPI003F9B5DA2